MTTHHCHGQKRLIIVSLWTGKERRRKMRKISGLWRRGRTQKENIWRRKIVMRTEGWTEGRESKVLRDPQRKNGRSDREPS